MDRDRERKLQSDYDSATKRLSDLGSSMPVASRNDVEQRFGYTYQRLVEAGLRPQIRAKYRRV